MRPVLFQFYTVETVLNMLLMFFHIRGFLTHPLDFLPLWSQINHYFYSASFYAFTVLTLFSSINICTGHQFSLLEEIGRTMIGSILYVLISLMTLGDAEAEFHLMYIMGDYKLEVEKPLHPFFEYMRAQAICALTCGVAYLLHAIIVIDVLLSNDLNSKGETIVEDSDELDEDVDFIPVRLYVLGEAVHLRLEQYEWFNDFDRKIPIQL